MLYVFQVDTGCMLTLDMNLALESVGHLKDAISNQYRIPTERQVLLVSGGECLESTQRVCTYTTAGTDTNPIFLFNTNNIENSSPTSSAGTGSNNYPGHPLPISSTQQQNNLIPVDASVTNLEVETIRDQVEGCLTLPPTYVTVVSRSQLAQQLHELAKEVTRRCERLIHEQHLQHQGWAAVIANLEDSIEAFRRRSDTFTTSFQSFVHNKERRLEAIQSFAEDLDSLKQQPLLPCLMEPSIASPLSSSSESGGKGKTETANMTLHDWIANQDSRPNQLDSLGDSCLRAIDRLNPQMFESLQKEIMSVMEKANLSNMKEIKGLEERLFGLNQLLAECTKIVQEQYDLSQAFLQNQNRASDLCDSSILPDLCASHQQQLLVMSKNHQQLDDIRRRCQRAKDELCFNLNQRLKWVIFVQRSVSDCGNKIAAYGETLRRLKTQFQIIKQIKEAPRIYNLAIREVRRRIRFNELYTKWTNEWVETLRQVQAEEMEQRQSFAFQFQNHFLTVLFPGLEDGNTVFRPYSQVVNEVKLYGSSSDLLPNVTEADMIKLKLEDFPPPPPPLCPAVSATSDEEYAAVRVFECEHSQQSESSNEPSSTSHNFSKIVSEHKHIETQTSVIANLLDAGTQSSPVQSLVESLKDRSNEEVKLLQEKLDTTSEKLNELNNLIERLREMHAQEIYNNTRFFEEEKAALLLQKETDMKEMKENFKVEYDGLRSRFKLMNTMHCASSPISQDQRSPSSLGLISPTDEHKSLPLQSEGLSLTFAASSPKLPTKQSATLVSSGDTPDDDSGVDVATTRCNSLDTVVSSSSKTNLANVFLTLDTSAIDIAAATSASPLGAKDGSGEFQEKLEANDKLIENLNPPAHIVALAHRLSGRISTVSCKVDEKVLVYYNDNLQAHMVFSSNKNVHFLHTDMKTPFDNDPDPNSTAFVANVTDKEFCVARRAQNRYRVPQGFHFYRVRVRVLETINTTPL